MKNLSNLKARAITAFLGLLFCIILYYFLPPLAMTIFVLTLLTWILFFEWSLLAQAQPILWWLTPLYPVAPFIIFLILWYNPFYKTLIPLMCLLTFGHDTAGYFFGNLWGKHPLCPKITPKKTYEGLFGGYFCTLLIVLIGYGSWSLSSTIQLTLIAFCVSTLATLGDLFESFLKRKAHLKDSGTLLPGHGGLLDRFDALLFVIPFFYILRTYIVQIINIT